MPDGFSHFPGQITVAAERLCNCSFIQVIPFGSDLTHHVSTWTGAGLLIAGWSISAVASSCYIFTVMRYVTAEHDVLWNCACLQVFTCAPRCFVVVCFNCAPSLPPVPESIVSSMIRLFPPHVPRCVSCICASVSFPSVLRPSPHVALWMCLQNHEQLRDHDSDLLRSDGDMTFTFGDTAITANGAGDGAGGSGWSVNGRKNGSTSEEALEHELDSREQELLSHGTRLVFPIEDHVWLFLPGCAVTLPDLGDCLALHLSPPHTWTPSSSEIRQWKYGSVYRHECSAWVWGKREQLKQRARRNSPSFYSFVLPA